MAKLSLRTPGVDYYGQVVKESSASMIEGLLEQFLESAKVKHSTVYLAETKQDAVDYILSLVKDEASVISHSRTLNEIGIAKALKEKGNKVVFSEVDEFAADLLGVTDENLGKGVVWPKLTATDLAGIYKEIGLTPPAKLNDEDILGVIKAYTRKYFKDAPFGISGATALVAETGTIVIQDNECNARLGTNMPPVHILVVNLDKIVPKLEDAVAVLRADADAEYGTQIATYLSFIGGPSRTGDIEFYMCDGMHGPMEVHVVIVTDGKIKK